MKANFVSPLGSIQKIALYETKHKYYVVGSNNSQDTFRILKIDRTEPRDLIIVDDGVEYTLKEITETLNNIHRGKAVPSIESAFGILGFIRFTEGHYMVLVTKRTRIATLGLHVIYKVEDKKLIYIPCDASGMSNKKEERYRKLFLSVDLSTNFYFSYSYDLTRSLQINMAPPRLIKSVTQAETEDNSITLTTTEDNEIEEKCAKKKHRTQSDKSYSLKNVPNDKFVWNEHLLNRVYGLIDAEWMLPLIHGFIGQSNLSVFGRSVYVTLIARRSNKYAGTRFLKRGANFKGDVANEVETEQIILDVGASHGNHLRVSSFVQMRGSIPLRWSQDISKRVTKPPIIFDLPDPYYETAGAHFNQLLGRYGSPIITLNLAKLREKKMHESQLSEQFSAAISYLNIFLPPHQRILYVSFDMARMNKGKESNVMGRLAEIADSLVRKTGIFLLNEPARDEQVLGKSDNTRNLQSGVIRVNCVDCLDRTNTAQFAVGKCALAYQLYYLGLLEHPFLEFDTDCVRLLEVLYEDHGDTLALQYGGSQLVHRINTYRKTAPWTSQGNDIMQTLSRYCSNTFSDAEKQNAINLFLGLFQPKDNEPHIWEEYTDYYLHHPEITGKKPSMPSNDSLTQWWLDEYMGCLPLAYDLLNKECTKFGPRLESEYKELYDHFYRTDELTMLKDTFEVKMMHSIRDFMPNCVTDFSPFTVRIRPVKMKDRGTGTIDWSLKSPSMNSNSSSSTGTPATSEDECDETLASDSQLKLQNEAEVAKSQAESLYGLTIDRVNHKAMRLYERYISYGNQNSSESDFSSFTRDERFGPVKILQDDEIIAVPFVKPESQRIYQSFVNFASGDIPNYKRSSIEKYVTYVNTIIGSNDCWKIEIRR